MVQATQEPGVRGGLWPFLVHMGYRGMGGHLGEGPGSAAGESGSGFSLQAVPGKQGRRRDPSELCLACVGPRSACPMAGGRPGRATSSRCLRPPDVRLVPTFIVQFAFQKGYPGSCREDGRGVEWRLGGRVGVTVAGAPKPWWLVCALDANACTASC